MDIGVLFEEMYHYLELFKLKIFRRTLGNLFAVGNKHVFLTLVITEFWRT